MKGQVGKVRSLHGGDHREVHQAFHVDVDFPGSLEMIFVVGMRNTLYPLSMEQTYLYG